jgi:hypothetical protein
MSENEEQKQNFDVENSWEHPLRRSKIKWDVAEVVEAEGGWKWVRIVSSSRLWCLVWPSFRANIISLEAQIR